MKRWFLLGLAAVGVTAVYWGWRLTSRTAYETAEYTLLESDGPFEIREYPDLLLATTSMQYDAQGDDGSFMRLFGYISGDNEAEQKVAMTTPVFMQSESSEASGQMGFVMPKAIAAEEAPQPTAEQCRSRSGLEAASRSNDLRAS